MYRFHQFIAEDADALRNWVRQQLAEAVVQSFTSFLCEARSIPEQMKQLPTLAVTSNVAHTDFILPDGTRLTVVAGRMTHAMAVAALFDVDPTNVDGRNQALAAVLAAGVVRRSSDGIEVGGPMTETQADVICAEWDTKIASLRVDVQDVRRRRVMDSKVFDYGRYTASTLRAWVNAHVTRSEGLRLRSFHRFITEAAFTPDKLRALMNTTTQPAQTRFVLPDGTRLKMADDRGEHSDAVAPYTLDEVLRAGVLRVRPTYGNDQSTSAHCRSRITEKQAQVIADDATMRNGRLFLDVQLPESSGYRTDYRVFDPPVKASVVRAWVNKHF